MGKTEYSIGELAERAGVSRRTVRFYVALGLISPPLGRGRGRHYTDQHLQEILTIRRLQAKGISLAEIQARKERTGTVVLPGEPKPPELQAQLVTRISLGEGVVLEFAHDLAALTPSEMQEIARRCREVIPHAKGREGVHE
uniref:MerR family transcriptional regulator n=1 Tax=Desulfobacca acetoxidans TaxID=60893 RepID=A0A7C3WHD9_9BACT